MIKTLKLRFYITHTNFCIVGGGSAGLNLSAHLAKLYDPKTIRIFQPSTTHYYQPGFTMVGGNLVEGAQVQTKNQKLYHKQINWTKDSVKKIDPTNNLIITESGQQFSYNQLIVASGIKIDWKKIKGAKEAIDDVNSPVVSIYTYESAQKTRKFGQTFKGGVAIFTQPPQPIKCGGAPQKILYLLTKEWQDKKINAQVHFYKPGETMFAVKKYSEKLSKIADSYGITKHFKTNLIEVRKDTKQAVFLNLENNQSQTVGYDFLHLVPPMSPHAYIAQSGLGNSAGFVDVDKQSLQHVKYPNIWSLGDCSSLPTSKTAAAIFSQTEILIKNMKQSMDDKPLTHKYNGYTCCPIFVGGDKLMLAQFLYDHIPTKLAYAVHLQKPARRYYWLKKKVFPYAYWNLVPKGVWAGRKGIAVGW